MLVMIVLYNCLSTKKNRRAKLLRAAALYNDVPEVTRLVFDGVVVRSHTHTFPSYVVLPLHLSSPFSACLPVYLSACLPVYRSVCLPACLFIGLSICLPACLPACLSACLSVCVTLVVLF